MNEAFWTAIRGGDKAAVSQSLAGEPGLLSSSADNGHGVVRMAWDCGHPDLARWLAAEGAPVSFHDAAALGETDRVLAMMDEEPGRLETHSHDGFTALHLAAFFGHDTLCMSLMARGASVDAVSSNPMANTPLQAAIAGTRNLAVIEGLIAAGADLAAVASQGITALHLAAARGDAGLYQRLRELGAPVLAMDDGRLPGDMARDYGHAELAETLKSS